MLAYTEDYVMEIHGELMLQLDSRQNTIVRPQAAW